QGKGVHSMTSRPQGRAKEEGRILMRKFSFVMAGVAFLVLAGVASAGNVHYASHPGQPSFTDQGTSLKATVDVAGLGNFNTEVRITANGNASGTSVCTNNGGNPAPGQNPAVFPV